MENIESASIYKRLSFLMLLLFLCSVDQAESMTDEPFEANSLNETR